jgi:hypothetical protein
MAPRPLPQWVPAGSARRLCGAPGYATVAERAAGWPPVPPWSEQVCVTRVPREGVEPRTR